MVTSTLFCSLKIGIEELENKSINYDYTITDTIEHIYQTTHTLEQDKSGYTFRKNDYQGYKTLSLYLNGYFNAILLFVASLQP